MLAEPLKSMGKKGKALKIARNSLRRKKARKSKKARKRRLGLGFRFTSTPRYLIKSPYVPHTTARGHTSVFSNTPPPL